MHKLEKVVLILIILTGVLSVWVSVKVAYEIKEMGLKNIGTELWEGNN